MSIERRHRPWLPLTRELGIVTGGGALYLGSRAATEGDVEPAARHAQVIVRFEREVGIFWEHQLQNLVLDHDRVVTFANWFYIWCHWPVIFGVGAWLLLRRPTQYALFRNAFLVSGGIGLAIFMLFPVAPPRLSDIPIVDTVTLFSKSRHVLQPHGFVNQYAAVPSLHLGWNLLIGIALARYAPHPALRAVGLVMPPAMWLATVLTGNHFIVDGVVGIAVALVGLRVAARWQHHAASRAAAVVAG
jgi:hypothetical protein